MQAIGESNPGESRAEPAAPSRREDAVRRRAAALARPGALLGGLVLAGAALHLMPAHLADLARSGHSVGTFILLAGLACAVGVPRQAAAFAGGYAFGLWPGAALALLATALACAGNFFWARFIGRDWARRRMGSRLSRADRFLARHPFGATLALRLLPVGNNLAVNLLAGVSGVRAAPFLAASLLGYVPQTAIFALAGSGTRLAAAMQIALAGGLLAASAGIGLVLMRRVRS